MAPLGNRRERFARVLDQVAAGLMILGKTQYLCELESLCEEYSRYVESSTGYRGVYKLPLLILLTRSLRKAEAVGEELRDHFIFDIDRDVDYEAWGKRETWLSLRTEASRPGPSPCSCTTNEKEGAAIACRVAELLPSEGAEAGALNERERLRASASTLIDEITHGGASLDHALGQTLSQLCMALREIDRAINEKHDSVYYKRIFQDQRLHYQEAIGQEVVGDYSAWKDQHLDDDIEEEALREHRVKAMERLFQAKVFDGIEDGAGRKKKEAYRREVSFDECDCPKPARFYKAYACFREVFDYRDGEYMIDEVKAGRLVFKIRKDPDKVKAFFRFVQTMALVSDDIDELYGRRRVESVCDGVDFSILHSRFSEEQAKASGIRRHADIVLALIDRMQREDIPKAHWIVFYCVLLGRGWIEDNLAAFCKSMKALFGVNLDKSSLAKVRIKSGDNVDQWPEDNKIQREKKKFGLRFINYLNAYSTYKKQLVFCDLE